MNFYSPDFLFCILQVLPTKITQQKQNKNGKNNRKIKNSKLEKNKKGKNGKMGKKWGRELLQLLFKSQHPRVEVEVNNVKGMHFNKFPFSVFVLAKGFFFFPFHKHLLLKHIFAKIERWSCFVVR